MFSYSQHLPFLWSFVLFSIQHFFPFSFLHIHSQFYLTSLSQHHIISFQTNLLFIHSTWQHIYIMVISLIINLVGLLWQGNLLLDPEDVYLITKPIFYFQRTEFPCHLSSPCSKHFSLKLSTFWRQSLPSDQSCHRPFKSFPESKEFTFIFN